MIKSNNIETLLAWVRKNGAWNNSHTTFVCQTCEKEFSCSPSAQSKFCSKVCYNEGMKHRKGEGTPNWKGGISTNNKCVDCQKKISHVSTRCKSCAAKLMPHMLLKNRPWLRTKEAIRKALLRHPISSLETKFQQIIDKHQLPYKYVGNGKFFIERKNPDFININGEKVAIEVYARKHKEKMRNMNIDQWKRERQEVFAKYGWEIVFFDETQVKEENVLSVLKGGSHF